MSAIFYPMVALVALTFAVLLIIPYARFRAAFRGEVKAKDFRYGESANVPGLVALPNRNLMNLLELPLLAWGYVGLRAAHSAVHLTYNNVFHRLAVFAASNVVLLVIWIRFVLALK